MKIILYIISVFLLSVCAIADQNSFLAGLKDNRVEIAENVFIFSSFKEKNKVNLGWDIKKGYYLYLSSILIENNNLPVRYEIDEANILIHEDEFFGETEIIRESLKISIENSAEVSNLKILYQGCSDKGFCYPIQTINLN
mgnify:CR=1 FL=1